MNGDMPHVPITTLAGIASLTDLLNQLPLPSPLPATTAKSLLYNGRISEEVSSLLVCRDENLVTQLAHSLNQVSTEHIELKDNLGNDEPEGDMPMLLQTLLSRNPKIFRDKSVMQQPMMQQYKMSQNQVHGSPGSNYQQTTVPQSSPGCFTSPQSGSGARFVPQQNSPIPSPYTPQSPADYMQYNPPTYSQHQQTQQVRNIHDNKVSGQLSSTSSNHNARLGSDEDYIDMAHRLGNEENDPSMRAATFPVKSPQSVCSPAESEETAKRSRPPLIMQSPPPDVPPGAAPELLLTAADRKKKHRDRSKEDNAEMDKNASYDIVSSPSKQSTRLTLKLSRVRFSDMDQAGDLPPRPRVDSDPETDLMSNNNQLSRTAQDLSHKLGAEEQANCQSVPFQPSIKESGVISGVVFDDAEMDTLAEIERIERETASERWSKEVQDKDKPLKKRKQDSYPQESGAEASDGPTVQGGNTDSKLTPKKTNSASNGASRPALMVSIDLQQAGRVIGQPVVVLEAQQLCEEHLRRLKSKTDEKADKDVENRPGIIKQHADNPRKSGSDGQPDTPKQKQDSRRESKRRHDSKTVTVKEHLDDRQPDMPRQKHDKHSDSRHQEDKNHNSHRAHVSQPETPKTTSKVERNTRHGEKKVRDRERDKERDNNREKDKVRDRDKDGERDKDSDRGKDRERDKVSDRDKDRDKDRDRENEKDRDKDRDRENEKDRDRHKDRDREKDKNRARDREKDRERDKDRDREKDKERDKDRDRVKEKDRERDKDRDRDKDRERDKDRDRDKDKDKEKDKDRDKDKDKEKDKDRDKNRDRDRERKHKTSRENCNRHSPDRHTKPDSPRVRQDGSRKSTDLNGRQSTESSSLQNSQNKKESKSGDDSISCQPGNKQQSFETKLSEFPSYLLGGKSGSLKNFVIPKLKRDGKDKGPQIPSKMLEGWKEPLVRLERVSLVENLNKRAKPVVVVNRLSIDEVKSIIQESRLAQSSRSRGEKRKHHMISKKSKYAESDEDDDSDDSEYESAKKRYKKDRDKTWKNDARKGSGSRRRGWNSSDDNEGSPPPSLNDAARKWKKKEKQKNRIVYDSKMTPEEMMDSSTFKRFTANVDNILESLEDVDLTAADDDEIPKELLLGKHQLSELGSDSAKLKAMRIFNK